MNGGAVFVSWRSKLRFERCLFVANSAADGGAFAIDTADLRLHNCYFHGNIGSTGGGAILASDGGVDISGSFLRTNRSGGDGGALLLREESDALIRTTLFVDNEATVDGGSLNQAPVGGGGPSCDGGSTVAARDAILWGNLPDEIFSDNGDSLDVRYSDLSGECTDLPVQRSLWRWLSPREDPPAASFRSTVAGSVSASGGGVPRPVRMQPEIRHHLPLLRGVAALGRRSIPWWPLSASGHRATAGVIIAGGSRRSGEWSGLEPEPWGGGRGRFFSMKRGGGRSGRSEGECRRTRRAVLHPQK
jgi:hypothetical protein